MQWDCIVFNKNEVELRLNLHMELKSLWEQFEQMHVLK